MSEEEPPRFRSISEFEIEPSKANRLGSGSFAQVFLARHKETSALFAIKTVG